MERDIMKQLVEWKDSAEKFSMKNVGNHEVEETQTYSVPLYLIWMLKKYLQI